MTRATSWRDAPAVVRYAGERRLPGAVTLAPGLLVHGPAGSRARRTPAPVVLGVDGCGVVAGSFVTGAEEAQEVVDARPWRSGDALGSTIRGACTVYLWRPDVRSVEVLPDPTGGLVYRYRTEDLEVLSSDIGAVLRVLADLGRLPARRLDHVVAAAITGSSGLEVASHVGVEVLEQLQYARMTQSGTSVLTYSLAEEQAGPYATYEEGLDAVEEEVLATVRAAVAHAPLSGHRLLQLDGGLSARVMLAAVRRLGLVTDVDVVSSAAAGTPDRVVVEGLAGELGLCTTEETGSTLRQRPTTLRAQASQALDLSHGMLVAGPHPGRTGSDTLVLAAGVGERPGRPPAPAVDLEGADALEATRRAAEHAFGVRTFSVDPRSGLFSRGAVDRWTARLHARRTSGALAALPVQTAVERAAADLRRRYQAAETTRVWNLYVHRVDPTVSLAAARLESSLPEPDRLARVVSVDLLRRWAPDLLALPFALPDATLAYEALRGPLPRRAFVPATARPSTPARTRPGPVGGGRTDVDAVTPGTTARARDLGVPLWQVRDLDRARADLRAMVDGLDPATRDEVLDPVALDQLLRGRLDRRAAIRQVHHLHSALSWYWQ